MKYPYLAASLPSLAMDVMPGTTLKTFVEQCKGVLSDEDHTELVALLAEDRLGCGSAFAADWFVFESSLRHRIAQVRASRLGLDSKAAVPYQDNVLASVRRVVVDAFAKSNPFEREWLLDQARWTVLEDLTREDPFGLNAILAHGLKLRLAYRWASMNDEKGRDQLEQQLNNMLDEHPTEAP